MTPKLVNSYHEIQITFEEFFIDKTIQSKLISVAENIRSYIDCMMASLKGSSVILSMGCLLRELLLEAEFRMEFEILAQKFRVSAVLSSSKNVNSGDKVLDIFNDNTVLALWK